MVHYIRFLKYPKLEIKRPWTSVKALVTVTTDLGDDFYRQEITLHATLIVPNTNTGWRTFVWKPGMRTLWVSFNDIPASSCRGGVRLLISSRRSVGPDEISLSNMPEVLSVRSQNFGFEHSHGGSMVERSLQIGGSVLHIYEESGESIARHIWDAGVALIAYIERSVRSQNVGAPKSDFSSLVRKEHSHGLRVIELGSGCGIVGIHIAHLLTKSHVVLSDLDDAMRILTHNIHHAEVAQDSVLEKMTLDWNQELPAVVQRQRFDLVVVSDCTYNCDSIPSLVKTIEALAAHSPRALTLVSMKVRHASEEIFFDLMSRAGLLQAEHDSVLLSGMDAGTIDFYVYEKRPN